MGKEVPASAEILRPSLVRNTAVMSVGTGLSRVTGLLRVIATAAALGVGPLADAYNTANITPNIVYDLVLGGVLSGVFVPVFVEWMQTRGARLNRHSARAIMTFTFFALLVVMALGMLLAGPIVHLYTVRDHGPYVAEKRALATFLLVLFMPQIVLYGLGAVATGLLNANRRFSVPMFAPILNNVVVIVTMGLFAWLARGHSPSVSNISEIERWVLGVGTTLGVIAMTVVLWPPLRRTGFRWRPVLDPRDEALRRIGRLAGWIFFYVATNQLGLIVVIVLANRVSGGVTAYSYALIFFQLPYAIFAVSVFTALLPPMSSRWTERDLGGVRSLLSQGVRLTALVIVPASLGYMALAQPIVGVLVQHGHTTHGQAVLISRVLVLFAAGLLPFSLFQLFLRGFYAMQDTRTPAAINFVATALNTVVNVILFRYLQVEGLALGQTIAYTFATLLAGLVLRRRLHGLDGRRVTVTLAKVGLAGLVTGGAAWLVAQAIGRGLGSSGFGAQLAQVVGGMAAGIAAFAGASLLLRIEELAMVRRLVMGRVRR